MPSVGNHLQHLSNPDSRKPLLFGHNPTPRYDPYFVRGGSGVPTFLFRCPNTGYRVQGFVAEEDFSDDAEDYQAVTCLACKRTHHVNPMTGSVLGANDE
jgi:hypothetical protein